MFLAELYGRIGNEGGMLGYVQSGALTQWTARIGEKLQPNVPGNHQLSADGAWVDCALITEFEHTVAAKHLRHGRADLLRPVADALGMPHTPLTEVLANLRRS